MYTAKKCVYTYLLYYSLSRQNDVVYHEGIQGVGEGSDGRRGWWKGQMGGRRWTELAIIYVGIG